MGESGLQEALFAELAAGAGVRAYGVPSHAGGLPANTGERRGGEKWTNAGIRPIRGWANRRPVELEQKEKESESEAEAEATNRGAALTPYGAIWGSGPCG